MFVDYRLISVLSIVAACLLMTGCGGSNPEDTLLKQNDTNLERLASMYTQYQADHRWIGPDSEETFRQYIEQDVPAFIKERIGISDTSALFVSQRDGQPFKIRLKVQGSARGCSEPAIFEAEGVDGKRMVGFLNMFQKEVDESEYNDLWEGKYDPADLVPTG